MLDYVRISRDQIFMDLFPNPSNLFDKKLKFDQKLLRIVTLKETYIIDIII
jgi:hypothetical protein